jgi:hypothetical protein
LHIAQRAILALRFSVSSYLQSSCAWSGSGEANFTQIRS